MEIMMTSRKQKKFVRTKSPKKWVKVVNVVTEGKKTEPNYFTELRKISADNKNLSVKIHPGRGGNVMELIKKAEHVMPFGSKLNPGDEIWVVVDDDERDKETIEQLLDWQKKDPKLNKLAGSNPLFEYWLLLHFENGNAVTGKKDCVTRLENWLKSELNNSEFRYKKGFPKQLITLTRIKDAIKRAKERDKVAIEKWPELRNTRVYMLVETILAGKLNSK